jgi:hypothetical protein
MLGMWTGVKWWSTKGEIKPVRWSLRNERKRRLTNSARPPPGRKSELIWLLSDFLRKTAKAMTSSHNVVRGAILAIGLAALTIVTLRSGRLIIGLLGRASSISTKTGRCTTQGVSSPWGEPVVFCDISHAHHCFLPALLGGRIDHHRQKHGSAADIGHYETELTELITFLSGGDYYAKWCRDAADPVEREEKKLLVTMILNWPNARCEGNALYRRMRRAFPLTFKICEAIKRNDHRNLCKSLQYCTARSSTAHFLKPRLSG